MSSRVRQNLGLVVGLQGRFAEAETIVKADLPPDQAAANVAYLKEMLNRNDGPRGARSERRSLRSTSPTDQTRSSDPETGCGPRAVRNLWRQCSSEILMPVGPRMTTRTD